MTGMKEKRLFRAGVHMNVWNKLLDVFIPYYTYFTYFIFIFIYNDIGLQVIDCSRHRLLVGSVR